MRLFFVIIGIIFSTVLFAQNPNVFDNRVIMKYHTKQDLLQMQQTDTLKFLYVKYYYIHSFILQPISCTNCPPYNPDLVDVSEYDHLRQEHTRVTFTDTLKGYKITLFSKNELMELIKYGAILSSDAEQKSASSVYKFPKYNYTGNASQDLLNYLTQISKWKESNPFEFYQLKNNPEINIINISDFNNYSSERKAYILQNTDIYILLNTTEANK